MSNNINAGNGGERYVPYDERTGNESIVYFTRDLSAEGLKKVYEKVNAEMTGKIGVKLHTGEPHGPNIIPREWVMNLMESEPELKNAAIVETNTYYERATATPPNSTARRWRSTAGRFARSTSWTPKALLCCRSKAASG